MKFTSLTHHLVLWFIMVALLPLLLFGYLSLRQNETALRTETQARMSRLADKKTMEIKVYLAERAQDVRMLAHGLLSEQAMSGLSRAYLQYRPGSDGYRRADQRFRSRFSAYIDESTLFYDVFLITPRGEIIYTDKHEADFATNLLDGPYRDSQLAKAFRESSTTLERSISDFEHYAPSGAPAAFIAAPIIRNGALRGVIAFQLSAENIYRVAMDSIGLGVTGETALAKLTGAGEAVFVAPLRHDPRAAMQRKIDLKTTVVPMRHALAGERGSGMGIDYAGKQVVAAWRYLPEMRWGMVVKMDADEVFAPIYQQRRTLLEILLTLILLAGVAALYFGRRLALPLKNFAQTANEIAQGDLDKRVVESGSGEIGALGRAFNRMAENLQSLYRTLENRIEERTRELSVANEQLQGEITERKQAALELARTYAENKWLQRFINITPDIVYFIDLEGRLQRWNTALEEFCGLSPDKMKGRPCVEFVCDQDKSVVEADVQNVFAKGFHANIYRFIRSDGALIPFHCNGTVTFNENGEPEGFAGLGRDISERERADNLIREENNFRKELINSLPGIFYMLDSSGRFLVWNKNLESVLHCSTEEIANSHPLDYFEGNDIELISENIRKVFEVGDTSVEAVLLAKNGAKIPYYFTGRRIERNGEPVLVGLGIDIAERKRAEVAVLQLNEELEIKVAARTAALEQAMLEVKQASRGKDEFLAAISHELKTPLNHILGFADLLKEGLAGKLNAEQKSMAQDIFDAGSKQLALVNSLIELARLQAGKAILQVKPEDPAKMLGEIATQHATKAKMSGLTFAVEVAEGLGEMPLDREVVAHLLDQLLSNAFKFTPSGGKVSLVARRVPRTEVAAPVRIETDEYLELAVTDNGPGIAPEIIPRLFQPFVQGDGRLSRSHQGSGVGLVLIRLLAELHGGCSVVQSEPGIGTRFLVWLPIGKQQQ